MWTLSDVCLLLSSFSLAEGALFASLGDAWFALLICNMLLMPFWSYKWRVISLVKPPSLLNVHFIYHCKKKTPVNVMLDITHKLFSQILSYLPCLEALWTCTILCHCQWPCHFIPLTVTLTVAEGHNISRKAILMTQFQAHRQRCRSKIWCGTEMI